MEINIEYTRGISKITATVNDPAGQDLDEYAFYLMRKSGELQPVKVAVGWYSTQRSYCFKLPIIKGHYYTICFKKASANSEQSRVISDHIYVDDFPDYKIPSKVYVYANEREFFNTREFHDGTHYVTLDSATLSFKIVNKKTETCFVSLAAAAKRDGTSDPIFTGVGLSKQIESSSILVSDPSVHADPALTLGWYAGNKNCELQLDLPRYINHILCALNAVRTILFGSSGGGFATLFYSTRITNAIALAVNPQTSIARFHAHLVWDYMKSCFNVNKSKEPLDSVLSKYRVQYSLVPVFERLGFMPKVVYLQNRSDWHYEEHLMYFLKSIGVNIQSEPQNVELYSDSLYTIVGRTWGDGHVPPPKELIVDLIRELEGDPTYWAGQGFVQNKEQIIKVVSGCKIEVENDR
ncbi:hypothetical protein CAP48_11505 [Advenella sp. S44]|uniref:hypothetical protein n=1 Tax=Advenella sp. S44 TaxID=1982755 RepID=UPI000C2B2CFD|nr:hypothetical protein [Advenella sp. S44]PJX24123.1 hypothetical protein CAP48_11505 [Advenella sp. S44]